MKKLDILVETSLELEIVLMKFKKQFNELKISDELDSSDITTISNDFREEEECIHKTIRDLQILQLKEQHDNI